jgi:feruloyl esterase
MMVSIAKALYPDPQHLDHCVLTKEALQTLAEGILEQCDEQDGLKDGIVADPGNARFDLGKVKGLTEEQRKAIEAVFAGARTQRGLIYPGFTPAAECVPDQWIGWLVGPVPGMKDHMPDLTFAFGTQVFKYLIFNKPDWDYSTYDFSNFEQESRLAGSFLNATNAVLDGLKERHGKLIIWHGWADTALPAQAAIDYYRQAQAHDAHLADYCRLFMVPGCLHCGGGPGPSEVDWLSVISDWVERSKAPDKLIAAKTEKGKPILTRPLYPYPVTAVYKGSGDPAQATNFEAKTAPENTRREP